MTSVYGLAAIDAVNQIKKNVSDDPRIAWGNALGQHCKKGSESWKKGCPKGTFLGLCEEGLIKGIPKGHYTDSFKNKSYGITALNMLKQNPNLASNKTQFWKLIPNKTAKNQNGQLDVVIALWENKMLVKFIFSNKKEGLCQLKPPSGM